jgi:non-lysosomal glucosylceramidase
LAFAPRLTPEKFKAPFTTAEGWGTFEQSHDGAKQVENIAVHYGRLRVKTLAFAVPENQYPGSLQVRLNGQMVNSSLQVSGSRILVTLAQETTVNTGGALEVTLT